MKIIFFTRLFYPHIGGVEKHVLNVSQQLIERGHKVIIITELNDSKLKLHEMHENIEIYRIPVSQNQWFKKFYIWWWLIKNIRLLSSSDILHFHDVYFWYFPFKLIWPFKKSFITFHGYEGNYLPTRKAVLMHRISEILANGSIAIGSFLVKWYKQKPNIISYGAVNVPQSFSKSKSSILNILFVGRLEIETGILPYIESLYVLKEKNIQFRFIIAGQGSLWKECKKLCQEGDIDCKLLGFKANLQSYYKNSDLVFASRYLAILEAMSFRKPVYAVYNNPIKKDYLNMTPFRKYIRISDSPKPLSALLIKDLKKYKQVSEDVEAGYKWVKDQTWHKLTLQYEQLWGLKRHP